MGNDYRDTLGVKPLPPSGNKSFVRAVNKTGGVLYGTAAQPTVGSDVCVLDYSAVALWAAGLPIPVTTSTGGDDPLVAGVVADFESTIPIDGVFWLQVAGLHESVRIDGTANITTGDGVGSFTTAGAADYSTVTDRKRLGIYVDAAYTTDATIAPKKVFLLNPQGLRPA